MWPKRSTAWATAASTDCGSVTSSAKLATLPALSSKWAAAGSRSVAATFQPCAAKCRTVAAPIPEEQPVIKTVEVMGESPTWCEGSEKRRSVCACRACAARWLSFQNLSSWHVTAQTLILGIAQRSRSVFGCYRPVVPRQPFSQMTVLKLTVQRLNSGLAEVCALD